MVVPLLLFAGALLFRLIGIGWGLKNDLHNHSYHPDETVVLGYSQAIDPAHGQFTPGFYNYGTLYLTVLKVATDMVATYTGGFDPKNPDSVTDFISRGILAGRILSALAGAATVWVLFLILRRRTNLLGAILGSLLVAVAPAHVVHSRFATVDVVAVFFVALSTHYALKLLPDRDGNAPHGTAMVKAAALSGLFAGLAGGTKYTGALVILTLLTAIAFRAFGAQGEGEAPDRKIALQAALAGIGAMILAFVIATPGVLLDQAAFMRDFAYEMHHTATEHGLVFVHTPSGFIYHLGNLFAGVGPLLLVLGVVGLVAAAIRKHAWAIAVLAFFLPYYLLIGRAEVKFLRYTFPLYVGLGVGFGWLMGKAHEQKGWKKGAVALGIFGVGGVGGGGLYNSLVDTGWMAGTDPRDAAARYLKGKGNALVAYASDPWFYSVPLFKDSAEPRPAPTRRLQWMADRKEEMDRQTSPRVAFYYDNPEDPFAFDVRSLDALKPDYVEYSSFENADLERLKDAADLKPIEKVQLDRYEAYMARLERDYILDRVFGGRLPFIHDLEYIQPTIYLWKRK